MYHVVFRTIAEGQYKGVITWTSFDSKEAFDERYDDEYRAIKEVVEEDVTVDRATELCKSDEAKIAHLRSGTVALVDATTELLESVKRI